MLPHRHTLPHARVTWLTSQYTQFVIFWRGEEGKRKKKLRGWIKVVEQRSCGSWYTSAWISASSEGRSEGRTEGPSEGQRGVGGAPVVARSWPPVALCNIRHGRAQLRRGPCNFFFQTSSNTTNFSRNSTNDRDFNVVFEYPKMKTTQDVVLISFESRKMR